MMVQYISYFVLTAIGSRGAKITNTNYNRGANLERQVKKYYESIGYKATRSAGSHGEADVWATNGAELVFVQCKIGADTKRCQKILEELQHDILGTFNSISINTVFTVVVGMKSGKPIVLAERYVKQADKSSKK